MRLDHTIVPHIHARYYDYHFEDTFLGDQAERIGDHKSIRKQRKVTHTADVMCLI